MPDSSASRSDKFLRQWFIPIILWLLTSIGLVSALVADGIWDIISWLTLGIPAMATLHIGVLSNN